MELSTRHEDGLSQENDMTKDDIRKEIEDAKTFLEFALQALNKNDIASMLGELDNACCTIEDLMGRFDEEDDE